MDDLKVCWKCNHILWFLSFQKWHVSICLWNCLNKLLMLRTLQELPKDKWFCCTPCRSIHSALQDLVIDGEQMLPEALLNLVRKKHEKKSSEVSPEVDIRWRLLSGKLASEDTSVWLSGAETIFHVFPLAIFFFFSALKWFYAYLTRLSKKYSWVEMLLFFICYLIWVPHFTFLIVI